MLTYPDTTIITQGAVSIISSMLNNHKDYETAPKIVSFISRDLVEDFNENYPDIEKKDITWDMIRATIGRVMVKRLSAQISTK